MLSGRSGQELIFLVIPGHALHEKRLQRHIGVVTLVNSQQRCPAAEPVMNRWSTGHFIPPPVYKRFPVLVLAKRRSKQLFTPRRRAGGKVGFWADRHVGTPLCSASPRPAVRLRPRRCDPPVVCPGIGFDRSSANRENCRAHFRKHEHNPNRMKNDGGRNGGLTRG